MIVIPRAFVQSSREMETNNKRESIQFQKKKIVKFISLKKIKKKVWNRWKEFNIPTNTPLSSIMKQKDKMLPFNSENPKK